MFLMLALVLQEESLLPGTPTETEWPMKGTTAAADGTELTVAAIRIERRWNAETKKFFETAAPDTRVRVDAVAARKSFSGRLPARTPGYYEIVVSEEGKRRFETRRALGRVDRLFEKTAKSVPKILDAAGEASKFADEIGAILEGKARPSPEKREDFLKRLAKTETWVHEEYAKSDLTATLAILRDICAHLRNAQVWGSGPKVYGDNDAPAEKAGWFVDRTMTLARLRDLIASVRGVVSRELRASTARILADLLERPSGVVPAPRSAAEAARKLLTEAPEHDAEYERLLGELAGETPPADAGDRLLQYVF